MVSVRKTPVAERLLACDFLASEKYTEFRFQNGDKMKGHKLIFGIASPVFEAMMYGHLAENENEIKISKSVSISDWCNAMFNALSSLL